MKFDELDQKLRVFETAHDLCVLPGLFIVARLDGRNFSRLTKEIHSFEVPFDSKFRDYMVGTAEYLMDCGFRAIYGYTESDEISLLLHRDENSFGRKLRKLNSILAGEASAKFTQLFGHMATFDCRISQLPNQTLVVDYFRWRNEDAHRNALEAHCYWALRKTGEDPKTAGERLYQLSTSAKNELLLQVAGINYNDLPNWQKRGVGMYWETYQKEAVNPMTGATVWATRKHLKVDVDLPIKEEYSKFIQELVLREHPQEWQVAKM